MSEWGNKRLIDYWEFNPKITVNKDDEYSFIEMPDLTAGNKHVYPKRKRKAKGLTKFQNGDTLFAKITPCLENGKICQAQGLDNNIGVGSTEFFVFRGRDGVSDTDFIHYLLKWYPIRKYAEKCMSGSAGHQRVPSDAFDEIELPLPDFEESVEIGKTLSNLDQKITILREQNQTLEELAQTLFKRWFVEFEFPNENGQPYKSSGGKMLESELGEIPEGWKVKYIGNLPIEITDYVANGSFASLKENVTLYPDEEEYALFIRNTDLKSGFKDKVFVNEHSYNFLKKTKLFGGEVIISNVGDVGSVFQCPYFDFPMTLGNNVIMLKSKFNNFIYLFFSGRIGQFLIKGITGGSAQPKFNKTEFKTLELPFPSENVLSEFEIQAENIFKKVTNNNQEIQSLTQLRDTLLPKLMSGELRVKK